MIYVFDPAQEMGECCGCPLSSTRLATFSAYGNLTADWSLANDNDQEECSTNACGPIAIVATAPNALASCIGQSGACNGGCDPTNLPGYSVTTASNLLGSVTHVQNGPFLSNRLNVTEVALFDDGSGDPTNLTYLQTQCGALVGNGVGRRNLQLSDRIRVAAAWRGFF